MWSPLGRATFLADPVIAGVAAKHGKTPAQVVIRWHLDSGLIVIPKSVRPERLKENIGVFDFRLDDADMRSMRGLDKADGRMGPDPGHRVVLRRRMRRRGPRRGAGSGPS